MNNVESLRLVVDALSNLGVTAKDSFVYWLFLQGGGMVADVLIYLVWATVLFLICRLIANVVCKFSVCINLAKELRRSLTGSTAGHIDEYSVRIIRSRIDSLLKLEKEYNEEN